MSMSCRVFRRLPVFVWALLLPCLALAQSAYPSWPLQVQPGPSGDPGQDPATYPKSLVPSQKPVKRKLAPLPVLQDAGNGDWLLSGGWKLEAAPKVAVTARELSTPGYDATTWIDATVPGTVLTSMVDQGLYPEPTYGLNNMAIPESLARQDYWYRCEFTVPADFEGTTFTLTFNGVNYAADVWLNGAQLGEIKGAFMRGVFNATPHLHVGTSNAIAVRVSPTPHPGIPHEESLVAGAGAPNGGSMTFDGPTFFCSEGWDWIPGIRDRETGLWQDVVLHVGSSPLVLGDVHVKTDLPLPDTSSADVFVSVALANRSTTTQRAFVRGEFEGVLFDKPVTLSAGENTFVKFRSIEFKQLLVQNPRLWWPNGYGKPELYHLKLSVLDETGKQLDSKALRFGIRHVTYELSILDRLGDVKRVEFSPSRAGSQEIIDKRHGSLREVASTFVPTLAAGAETSSSLVYLGASSTAPFLVIKVNGQRVVCKGGNWGLDEALKRVDRARLEPYFRLERDMGLTMIRNWCGQNTEEVFYELADEYGLMVWNDFWASTQNWNQQPGDLRLWLANAEDTIKRFRNHPSIVLWCGRNEGVPPPALNEGLDALVREHDGSRYYQPSSIKLNLLDSGPWIYGDPLNFFTKYGKGFTTELGLPCAPTADALRAMMPEQDLWPISDTWAYHDWHQKDHGEVPVFMEAMARQFGKGTDLEDFCRKAQMMNYVGHRALFEGLNANLWRPASGRLIWMSHPTWPSTEWQLYSSDYDPNGATFGVKKACEPVHVQFNPHDRKIVVANTTLADIEGVLVQAGMYDLSGKLLAARQVSLHATPNAVTEAFILDESRAENRPLVFLKLALRTKNGQTLSDNFYWLPKREEDHQELNNLRKATLTGSAIASKQGDTVFVDAVIKNGSQVVALLLRPTLRNGDGGRVLPAYLSDGYFSLLPGESRRFSIEVPRPAEAMQITFEGWNNVPLSLPVQMQK